MHRPRAALVTGASSGIGRACALAAYQAGYEVFAGVRSESAARSLTEETNGALRPVHLDVTESGQIDQVVASIGDALGGRPLSGLVNNAGVAVSGPVEHVALEDWRRQFEVNVIGLVAVTQAFLPQLRRSRGRVVNVGSSSGYFAAPLLGPYAASKHALEAITDALRVELRPAGVRVALVQPGAIATPIWRKATAEADAFERQAPPELDQHYGELVKSTRRWAQKAEAEASSPQVVARDVVHALTARRPRARYRQGKNAWTEWCMARLPDRLRDRLLAQLLGMG